MKCKECKGKLIFYINNELNNHEQIVLKEHIQSCSSCNIAYEQLSKKLAIIDKEKELIPNPYLSTIILQKIENATYKSKNQRQRILQPIFLSLIISIALFTGILLGNSYHTISSEEFTSEQTDGLFFNDLNQENIELTLLTDQDE